MVVWPLEILADNGSIAPILPYKLQLVTTILTSIGNIGAIHKLHIPNIINV
jgi:hypothetical protein